MREGEAKPLGRQMPSRSFTVLDSKARAIERQRVREENAALEATSIKERLSRGRRESIDDRVAKAVLKIRGANVPATIQLLMSMSSRDRDVYLIAEEIGQNRKQVLGRFPPARKSVRAAYFGDEAAPDQSPPDVEQVEGEEPRVDSAAAEQTEEQRDDDQEA